jgi:uncharacterized protein
MSLASHPVETDSETLPEIVRRILQVNRPAAIILFGSVARGDSRQGSDLDILIVERQSSLPPHRRGASYRMALLGIGRAIDLLVYTPQEIEQWANVPQAFLTTALREGKVLYEDGSGFGARLVG